MLRIRQTVGTRRCRPEYDANDDDDGDSDDRDGDDSDDDDDDDSDDYNDDDYILMSMTLVIQENPMK